MLRKVLLRHSTVPLILILIHRDVFIMLIVDQHYQALYQGTYYCNNSVEGPMLYLQLSV